MVTIAKPNVYERGSEKALSPGVSLFMIGLRSDDPKPMPVNMAEFIVQPGSETVPEDHDVREMWYVIEGQGELRSGDRVLEIKSGQVAFMESGVRHCAANTFDHPLRILACWWVP